MDVLEFAGTLSAKLNGQALEASQIKVDGQTITLTLTEEQVKANGGQAVELTFDAKIKAGANLSAYVKEDGRTCLTWKVMSVTLRYPVGAASSWKV
ncbi:hypothetical protein V470_10270 [Streptococcus sp. VT 162]|nr:hypothetical protein V470_10270 [Streptococcus sp. VT 162]